MPAKISITGKRVSPITTTNDYYFFDMLEKGSPSAPKGLPLAGPVLYSVLVGLKPGKNIDLLNCPDEQYFSITGEVAMNLPKKICSGQIGVIAFNIQLFENKKKKPAVEELIQENKNNVVNAEKQMLRKKDNPFSDEEIKGRVHLKYDGKCTECSGMMDKKVARFKLIDQNLPPVFDNILLICPDCYKKRKNPALGSITIAPKARLKLEGLGMDQQAINQFFSGFINKFVLIGIIESTNFREYWVPGKQPIIRFKVVDNEITDLQIVKNRIPQSI